MTTKKTNKFNIKQFFKDLPHNFVSYIKVATIELSVIALIIVVDLISKALVAGLMQEGDSITLIPKLLNFTYVKNYAAAFGSAFGLDKLMGENGVRIFFIIITLLATIFFTYLMVRNKNSHIICRLAYAFIIAGAIGNLIDRVFLGYVRDFIEIEYLGFKIFGSYSFAIFNVADMGVTFGVIFFIIYYIFLYKEPNNEQKNQTQGENISSSSDEDNIEQTIDNKDQESNTDSVDKDK